MNTKNIFQIALCILIGFFLFFISNYFLHIPLNLKFPSLIIVLAISIAIPLIFLAIKTIIHKEDTSCISNLGKLLLGLFSLYLIYALVTTNVITNAKDYRGLLGEVKNESFNEKISPIDLSQIPAIDEGYSLKIAESRLGELSALGSEVKLGSPTIQQVNGILQYVIPLEHSGFFQWLSNKEGTPGYITVNANNPSDVKLVTSLNGEDLTMKYLMSAYFSDDIRRYSHSENKTIGLTDYSFELNDSGRPYWVISQYEKQVGVSGRAIVGIMIVDAQNGEITQHDMSSIPSWVDRVQPLDTVDDNINSWGKYVNGFTLSKKDKLKATEGTNTIYNNGNCYYYTGMTSVGSDESTIGFMLVDTKTGESTLYKIPGGITEVAASQAIEGKVQQFGYTSTMPTLINVQNQPTYFTLLKDNNGDIKMYGMVNVQQRNIIAVGETLAQTMNNYVDSLTENGSNSLATSGEVKIGEGTVERIGLLPTDKGSLFYIITKENKTTLVIAPSSISKELPITKEGDKITFEYVDMGTSDITIKTFNNLNLEIK
ncbi:MAG: cell shape-determining protein [Clostridium sp.]|uniref:cell shape-determining protein n=1 Tax=Clostridium sp. TaxID=1506 RepID=UPI00302F4336